MATSACLTAAPRRHRLFSLWTSPNQSSRYRDHTRGDAMRHGAELRRRHSALSGARISVRLPMEHRRGRAPATRLVPHRPFVRASRFYVTATATHCGAVESPALQADGPGAEAPSSTRLPKGTLALAVWPRPPAGWSRPRSVPSSPCPIAPRSRSMPAPACTPRFARMTTLDRPVLSSAPRAFNQTRL